MMMMMVMMMMTVLAAQEDDHEVTAKLDNDYEVENAHHEVMQSCKKMMICDRGVTEIGD